jgi:hypothetical protein
MNASVSQYPLIGELIYVFRALNRWYYINTFNVSNRVTAQDLPELLTETDVPNDTSTKISRYKEVGAPRKISKNIVQLGNYFQDKPLIYRLKQFEGDLTLEGRSGSSIRFGAAWKLGIAGSTAKSKKIAFQSTTEDQSANLLMRVGPDPLAETTVNSTFGQVIEDINRDATSIWMVADQIIPIKLSTESSKLHRFSISNFPAQFNGSQIVLNSNRIIINAKQDKILVHASKGIHLTTLDDITLDSDKNHVSWTSNNRNDRTVGHVTEIVGKDKIMSTQGTVTQTAGKNHTITSVENLSLQASKIYVGSQSSQAEPLILGATLQQALEQLIQILTSEPIILTTGAPGSPSPQNPTRILKLKQWQQQYLGGNKNARILSIDNFTTRNNDEPPQPRKISPYKEG